MRRHIGDTFFVMLHDEACQHGICSGEDGLCREGDVGNHILQKFAAWIERAEDVCVSS